MRLEDTRGILHPTRMFRHVDLRRYPPPAALAGLVDWFWSVRWDIPAGEHLVQDVASQPGVNLSIGDAPLPGDAPAPVSGEARWVLNGVVTGVARRVLSGRGWNLAAKTTIGGFGAWCDDVASLTDRVYETPEAINAAGLRHLDPSLPAQIDPEHLAAGADLLAEHLTRLLAARDPNRVAEARDVAHWGRLAETDRRMRRVDDLARTAGLSARTLQRRFASHAGVSPTWVVRRSRLLDAAELVRDGAAVNWAEVAVELGYADQAHLVRDFTATVGASPAAYARAQVQP